MLSSYLIATVNDLLLLFSGYTKFFDLPPLLLPYPHKPPYFNKSLNIFNLIWLVADLESEMSFTTFYYDP